MIASTVVTRGKHLLAALLVAIMFFSPFSSNAETIFETIQGLQQQIQVIESLILDSEDATVEEKNDLLDQLAELQTSLSNLQLAIGDNSAIRTNIRSIMVTGDVRDFTAKAVIAYDSEIINGEKVDAATTTYRFSYTSQWPEEEYKTRARELRSYILKDLSDRTGLPYSFVYDQAFFSFKKFDSADEVTEYFDGETGRLYALMGNDSNPKADKLLDMFGRFSVIESIEATIGEALQDGDSGQSGEVGKVVTIGINTDQNETLELLVGKECTFGGGDGGWMCRNGTGYMVRYYIEDVLVTGFRMSPGTYDDVQLHIRQILRKTGIGEYFKEGLTDIAFADMLTDFVWEPNQTVYIEFNMFSVNNNIINKYGGQCTVPRIKEIVAMMAEYFMQGYQYDGDVRDIMTWTVPKAVGVDRASFNWQCVDINSDFFEGLPTDWTDPDPERING